MNALISVLLTRVLIKIIYYVNVFDVKCFPGFHWFFSKTSNFLFFNKYDKKSPGPTRLCLLKLSHELGTLHTAATFNLPIEQK